MTTATWNGATIAESDKTVVVEGNHYFPPESIRKEFLQRSSRTSRCPWKGIARYYSLVVDGKTNEDAAWYYPEPSTAAVNIKDYVAFWTGLTSGSARRRPPGSTRGSNRARTTLAGTWYQGRAIAETAAKLHG
jgi:uncharacterized protein (DUF427 family)